MPDILRDPVWVFITAVFTILAVVIPILLAIWAQRHQRKALSYEIIYLAPLIREEEFKARMTILLHDKPVQNIHWVVARILNSGNLPIIADDYERPVSLCFSENTQIISARVYETNPKSLQATINIESTKVVLAPVLLNSGDSITLSVLVDQFDQLSVDGRIVGIKDIGVGTKDIRELQRIQRTSRVIMSTMAYILLFAGVYILVMAIKLATSPPSLLIYYTHFIPLSLGALGLNGIAFGLFGLYWSSRRR